MQSEQQKHINVEFKISPMLILVEEGVRLIQHDVS